jgi:hypothetical protein
VLDSDATALIATAWAPATAEAGAERPFDTVKVEFCRMRHHLAAQPRLRIAEGYRTASLSVVPFSDDVSQLLITGQAGPGEDSTTSRVRSTPTRPYG